MKEAKFAVLLIVSWAIGTQIHLWFVAGLFSDITYLFILTAETRSPGEINTIVTGFTMYTQTLLWAGLTAAFLLMGKPIVAGVMYGFLDTHTFTNLEWFFPDGHGTSIASTLWPVFGRVLMVVVLLVPLALYLWQRHLTKQTAVS